MLKSDIRKQALKQRDELTELQLSLLNEKLLERFKTLDFSKIKSIHIFLPIAHRKEPDTFLLIDWLQANHPEIEIIVPKADFTTSVMSHYSFKDRADLLHNHYHIPEPQQAKPFIGTPDMVIVPLLAFDNEGYRVGYGKGFYDRFLQNINTQKIGLSFFDAIPKIIDVNLNDVKLDSCITPEKIIDFS